ncbi:diacylglycerol kinase family protein [Candidatus Kaiserbacteria bacterium]|nr:diacylglycerol kinase family protein [Candidatus Kaiserbacteria bacterium]
MSNEHISLSDFHPLRRVVSFGDAFRGVFVFFSTTPHAWVHALLITAVTVLGVMFGITHVEWALVVLSGGVLLAAEAFNTAIEIDIDLTSPEYHPYARDTKDVAAGAVLIAALAALGVWVAIFTPYLF